MILMWTGNLSVGIKYFDEDHKRLIGMIHDLHFAIKEVDGAGQIAEDEIDIALHRLENYFQYHCKQEEVFMAKVGYPGLEAHKLHHAGFLAKVTEMSQSFAGSRDPAHAAALMQFMYDWLTNHINVEDKKYGEFLFSEKISQEILEKSKPSGAGRNRILLGGSPDVRSTGNRH
jgi:hemerythrin